MSVCVPRVVPRGEHLSAELSSPYFVANFFSEHHPSFWRIAYAQFIAESLAEIPDTILHTYSNRSHCIRGGLGLQTYFGGLGVSYTIILYDR